MAVASDQPGDGLTFRMLGPLQVARGAVPVELGGRQQRAVLARLLIEARSAVSIDRLADALWGQGRPPGNSSTLQTYIFHLRAVLEPGRARGAPGRVLGTVAGGAYLLDADDDMIDAKKFESAVHHGQSLLSRQQYSEAASALAGALAMWRGDVFADLEDFGFLQPTSSRLAELRLCAEESRIDAELGMGRHQSAVAALDQVATNTPLRERLQWQRMLALYRSGRQSEALSAYRHTRALLNKELGIEPSAPLQQLHQAILSQDPGLDWHPPRQTADSTVSRSLAWRVPAIEISLLGEVRVAIDGKDVSAKWPPRTATLLTYLVLHHDAAQRREHLAGLFWPESTDAQARTNLRRELHQLRTLLPDADRWIAAAPLTVTWRLDDACGLDVARFEDAARAAADARRSGDLPAFGEAATAAIDLYRGELAPGGYDEWLVAAREQLRRTCVTLIDQLTEVQREVGDLVEAGGLARRRIELEPLEEIGYRTLLKLQALQGDRAAAMQTYHRCVSMLENELGVGPDVSTVAEYERLAGRQPSATAEPESAARCDEDLAMVGREIEMGLLQEHWHDAVRGIAGFVLVAGEAGVGKSRLLDEIISTVGRTGAVTARARCFAAQNRLPLAPVSEWLRSQPLVSARGRLEPVWVQEVDRLVPLSDTELASTPSPLADAWQRHRFLEGLTRALLAPNRPTLLVLDDLQWCDEDTLACLQLLLRLAENRPVLVVAAIRVEELEDNPRVGDFLRVVHTTSLITDVPLGPLTVEQSGTLAEAILGAPDLDAEVLHRTTGGYPLFVVESARARRLGQLDSAATGQLPRIRAVLSGRIGQASARAQELASLAAAIGRDFSVEVLLAASDVALDVGVGALDELWRRRIIREHSATTYDFSHDLLRDAAYQRLSPPRRSWSHMRVAEALEKIHAGDLSVVGAALADQYERAGQGQRAVPHHVRAAEAAISVFANLQAIRHYRRAVQLLQDTSTGAYSDAAELEIRQAMSAPLNAQYGFASAELQTGFARCIELGTDLGDTRSTLLAMIGLHGVRLVQGHIIESHEIAQRSLALSQRHPDLAGQAHFIVGGASVLLAQHQQAFDHFVLAEQLGRESPPLLVGTYVDVFAAAYGAHACWLLGHDEAARRYRNRAIARAEELDHPHSLALALAYAGITCQLCGESEEMLQCVRRLEDLCTRYDFAYYREWATVLQGWFSGGIDGADQIRGAVGRLRKQGALVRHPYYLSLLAETLINVGRTDAAGAVLDAAKAAAAAHEDRWWVPELWRLDARRHPGPRGEGLLRRAIALADEQHSPNLRLRAAADLERRERDPNATRTHDRLSSETN